jgi:hypothetical protein
MKKGAITFLKDKEKRSKCPQNQMFYLFVGHV